tara:strand:- start:72326 stop:72898 length:573 start_codon:yes stop_codon:yes gene_type:complete
MPNPFEKIRANSNDQQKSFDWYMRQVREVAKRISSPSKVLNSEIGELTQKLDMGSMYLFKYDAKHKDTLPYYDGFPLCLPIEPAPGGFYGMNLHYLPHGLRAQLLGKLLETADNSALSSDTKMAYNWDMLKNASRFAEVKPCVKRYLTVQMQSRFLKINPQDWKAAIFLPVENFKGASKAQVYTDSREMI